MERLPLFATIMGLALLAACASPPPNPNEPPPAPTAASPRVPGPSQAPHYRCDHDIEFTVRFDDGSAQLDAGAHGSDTLLRDAGGVTPQQTVYSSTTMKAEFGLGADGREATLNIVSPPLQAHCVRE